MKGIDGLNSQRGIRRERRNSGRIRGIRDRFGERDRGTIAKDVFRFISVAVIKDERGTGRRRVNRDIELTDKDEIIGFENDVISRKRRGVNESSRGKEIIGDGVNVNFIQVKES